MMATFTNFTQHDIIICTPEGNKITIPRSGYEVRLISIETLKYIKNIDGIPIYEPPKFDAIVLYKGNEPIINPEEWKIWDESKNIIVSTMVAEFIQKNKNNFLLGYYFKNHEYFEYDLVKWNIYGVGTMPNDTLRDEKGTILGNTKLQLYC